MGDKLKCHASHQKNLSGSSIGRLTETRTTSVFAALKTCCGVHGLSGLPDMLQISHGRGGRGGWHRQSDRSVSSSRAESRVKRSLSA